MSNTIDCERPRSWLFRLLNAHHLDDPLKRHHKVLLFAIAPFLVITLFVGLGVMTSFLMRPACQLWSNGQMRCMRVQDVDSTIKCPTSMCWCFNTTNTQDYKCRDGMPSIRLNRLFVPVLIYALVMFLIILAFAILFYAVYKDRYYLIYSKYIKEDSDNRVAPATETHDISDNEHVLNTDTDASHSDVTSSGDSSSSTEEDSV